MRQGKLRENPHPCLRYWPGAGLSPWTSQGSLSSFCFQGSVLVCGCAARHFDLGVWWDAKTLHQALPRKWVLRSMNYVFVLLSWRPDQLCRASAWSMKGTPGPAMWLLMLVHHLPQAISDLPFSTSTGWWDKNMYYWDHVAHRSPSGMSEMFFFMSGYSLGDFCTMWTLSNPLQEGLYYRKLYEAYIMFCILKRRFNCLYRIFVSMSASLF